MALTLDNTTSNTNSSTSSGKTSRTSSISRHNSIKNKFKSLRKELKLHQSKPLPPLPPTRRFNSTSSTPNSFSSSTFSSLNNLARSKSVSLPINTTKQLQQQQQVPTREFHIDFDYNYTFDLKSPTIEENQMNFQIDDQTILPPLPPTEYDSTITSISSLEINNSSCINAGHNNSEDDHDEEEEEDDDFLINGNELMDVDKLACSILKLININNREIQWNI